jgi:hypothetical protein
MQGYEIRFRTGFGVARAFKIIGTSEFVEDCVVDVDELAVRFWAFPRRATPVLRRVRWDRDFIDLRITLDRRAECSGAHA